MRTFLMLSGFLCASVCFAQSHPEQSAKLEGPALSPQSEAKVLKILTEDDLLAYQATLNLKKPRINLAQPELLVQVAVINKHIKDGIMFGELTGSDLRKVQNALKRFSKLGVEMEGSGSGGVNLTPQLLAEQDKINAMLDKAQKDSVFECYSTMTTGTHFIVRKCRTVAQLRRMSERDQNSFQRRAENKLDAPRNGGSGGAGALGSQ